MQYDPNAIEKRWQQCWESEKAFASAEVSTREKYYILDMFPYPSGAGLHVGHLIGYTATDIVARFKRMGGLSVLHPMGWDSFGLPAEQYAIRTGTHPAVTTDVNIRNFKAQLKGMGYSYDWEREIRTSDPSFYKWTQWIFTKLYEKGLAYQADLEVNWCSALKAVLANEEVSDGLSVEGGHPVEKRPLRQWVLKITDYAERLLHDLDDLDWPHGLKKLQENWIGRSEGVQIDFSVEGTDEKITVFTTRHDTIFGSTFLVLSPEHPLVELVTKIEQKEVVESYKKAALAKSDVQRSDLTKEKSGVYTGGVAINPISGEPIPIWIADYVLMGYGTGAVMGVPSHDARDMEFVETFGLSSRQVIDDGLICNSKSEELDLDGMTVKEAKESVANWLERKGIGKRKVNYKLRDWLFSRQRYWGEPIPVVHFEDGTMRALKEDELPLLPPEVEEYRPSDSGESPLAQVKEWVEVDDRGRKGRRETNTMPQWGGSCWYYLRFLDPHNDQQPWDPEKEKYWMPIDLYVGGAEHAVLHLLYARFWHKVLYDLGYVSTKEPFKKLCNQGLIVSRAYKNRAGAYVESSEVVEREGRYFHWQSQEELKSSIEKMSKSKLNGVSPKEVIEEFGTDALRLYCMFMGPIDKEKVWNTDSVSGCRRFLNRFFELATSDKVKDGGEGLSFAHKLVAGVERDIELLHFNTAISKMMTFVNEISKLDTLSKEGMVMAVQALSPFAPHIAEELWLHLGQKGRVHASRWPKVDPEMLTEESVTYIVQVNGRLRGRFPLPKDQTKEQIMELAKKEPSVTKHLTGEIQRVIFVPNKLLNIVVK